MHESRAFIMNNTVGPITDQTPIKHIFNMQKLETANFIKTYY